MTIQRDDPERRPGSASILRMSVPELAQWSSVVHAFTVWSLGDLYSTQDGFLE